MVDDKEQLFALFSEVFIIVSKVSMVMVMFMMVMVMRMTRNGCLHFSPRCPLTDQGRVSYCSTPQWVFNTSAQIHKKTQEIKSTDQLSSTLDWTKGCFHLICNTRANLSVSSQVVVFLMAFYCIIAWCPRSAVMYLITFNSCAVLLLLVLAWWVAPRNMHH